MILSSGTTVAVADGRKFRLFRAKGISPHISLTEIPDIMLGMDHAGSGSRHHSGSANPDRHRQSEDDFAASASGVLNKLNAEGAIDHLFLIADPRTLGEMRRHFHASLREKIIGELAKDFTEQSVSAIEAAIANA